MPSITLSQVEKRFGQDVAVAALDITIAEGEFFSLVGPSGCGKTTTMRMIGGLETPTSGRISIGDKDVFDAEAGIMAPPATRGIGMVFQSYALWPHMTVRANVGFGLDVRGIKGSEATTRINNTLEQLQIRHLADRYPGELSGGQQQRVALARELIVGAKILQLDEPLSNLDAKLRMEMRIELKRLHAESGATFIYVTHDQMEALTLSTRMAVMRQGVVQQVGTPREIYETPANLFVAEFLSINRLNVLQGVIKGDVVQSASGDVPFAGVTNAQEGARVKVGLRPDDLRLGESGGIPSTVDVSFVAGSMTLTTVITADGNKLLIVEPYRNEISAGAHVHVLCDAKSVLLFEDDSELRIA
ncbi:MAG: ABC transporter ATP-binding protein [Halomonas sp.]|nr:ABC transporter ATP-binding protein [Halomonas sp.]MBR2514211.1 ABC transporter ATP-binding protein [Halomonas sp.]